MGSAMAFIITDSATKIANLAAIKFVLGARHFSCYLFFTLCFVFATGVIVDALV